MLSIPAWLPALQGTDLSVGADVLPAGPDLTRYALVCGGLLALVLLAAYGFRRGFARTLAARAARRSLRVVDVLPLGGSKRLVVVHCYDRVFLVGQGEKELCSIAELDVDQVEGPEVEDASKPAADAIPPSPGAARLRKQPAKASLPPELQGQDAVAFAQALLRAGAPAPTAQRPSAPLDDADAGRDEPPRRPVLEDGRGILG